jgi:UDP-galactose transporter
VTLLSEVLKFPILAIAIAVFESPRRIWPTVKKATENFWLLAWVALAYATQNLLYFVCLDHISPAGYQVLSQTKLIFTAGLMRVMLGKRFSRLQTVALALLVGGAVATQLGEMSGAGVLGGKGNVLLGCSLTVLSSILSALPNVFYERILKRADQDEWAANLQLTTWIAIWVIFLRACSPDEGFRAMEGSLSGLSQSIEQMTVGFTPAVWMIVFLKTLNCVIIPACLKYADNILYGYAKPVSIVLTCVVTSLITSSLPVPSMFVGFGLVLLSMWLYRRG